MSTVTVPNRPMLSLLGRGDVGKDLVVDVAAVPRSSTAARPR
jgi:hypothetical protein